MAASYLRENGKSIALVGGIGFALYITFPVLKGVYKTLANSFDLLGSATNGAANAIGGAADVVKKNPSSLLPFPFNLFGFIRDYNNNVNAK